MLLQSTLTVSLLRIVEEKVSQLLQLDPIACVPGRLLGTFPGEGGGGGAGKVLLGLSAQAHSLPQYVDRSGMHYPLVGCCRH